MQSDDSSTTTTSALFLVGRCVHRNRTNCTRARARKRRRTEPVAVCRRSWQTDRHQHHCQPLQLLAHLVPQLLQTRLVQQVHLVNDKNGHESWLAAEQPEQRSSAALSLGKVHLLLQQVAEW